MQRTKCMHAAGARGVPGVGRSAGRGGRERNRRSGFPKTKHYGARTGGSTEGARFSGRDAGMHTDRQVGEYRNFGGFSTILNLPPTPLSAAKTKKFAAS